MIEKFIRWAADPNLHRTWMVRLERTCRWDGATKEPYDVFGVVVSLIEIVNDRRYAIDKFVTIVEILDAICDVLEILADQMIKELESAIARG